MDSMTQRMHRTAEDLGKLFLRLSVSAMMLTHGWPKLRDFAERAPTFKDPLHLGSSTSLGLAVFAELFCAILVAVGLATRAATVPLVITMVVAAWFVHGGEPWAKQERAVLFGAAYLAIALLGPGRYSLDARIRRFPFVP